jgi:spermidine synthase
MPPKSEIAHHELTYYELTYHESTNHKMKERTVILISVLIAGLCSILYELELSTTSSYFLGDSVKQFSLIIGVYMASMGVGSYLTKYVHDNLPGKFIYLELALGLIGGFSVPIAYFAYNYLDMGNFQVLILALTAAIGLLTGLEIPILTRILKDHYPLNANLANVLSLDYIGALIATLLFPFIFLPKFGLFRTSLFFGLVNVLMGFMVLSVLDLPVASSKQKNQMRVWAYACIGAFLLAIYLSKDMMAAWEKQAFSQPVIWSTQSPYQHLAVTQKGADIRLYLNNIIQFSSLDEYRYHESLTILPMAQAARRKQILILGGGEGLIAKQALKFRDVEQITIVDLDTAVFKLANDLHDVRKVNNSALTHPKVKCITADASMFLRESQSTYDVIISDLPDPSNEGVARLYSTLNFHHIRRHLNSGGVFATQATSPFHTNDAFWCIHETLRAAGFAHTLPYHVMVPTFGDWGFIMASDQELKTGLLPQGMELEFLDEQVAKQVFYFEKDLQPKQQVQPNKLDQLILLDYYLKGWTQWSKEK